MIWKVPVFEPAAKNQSIWWRTKHQSTSCQLQGKITNEFTKWTQNCFLHLLWSRFMLRWFSTCARWARRTTLMSSSRVTQCQTYLFLANALPGNLWIKPRKTQKFWPSHMPSRHTWPLRTFPTCINLSYIYIPNANHRIRSSTFLGTLLNPLSLHGRWHALSERGML